VITLTSIDLADPTSPVTIAELWGAACGTDLAISPALAAFNIAPDPDIAQAGVLASESGAVVGFALASAAGRLGWVDAIAVRPEARRRGAGAALLAWAEGWLAEGGCAYAQLGGSLRPFVPGLPAGIGPIELFIACGYCFQGDEWDVARDLAGYASPPRVSLGSAAVAPLRPGEEGELHAFLQREFPERWAWEAMAFLRDGGRPADYLLLRLGGQVAGFCQIARADSLRPIDRFYHGGLPQPWGQLGPIGVGAAARGRGLGAALLDAGLRHLRDLGVRGCVIDWTDLLDFYAKFGFRPHRRYLMLRKPLG
jgi:GNAT superfamily N-acetyltransferase